MQNPVSIYKYLVIILTGLLSACGPQRVHHSRTFIRMSTVTDITVVEAKGYKTKNLWQAVDSLLKDWEERFSQTHPRSEVSLLNTRSESCAPAHGILAEMMRKGLAYGDSLNGGFDLTVLPVKVLWGFGEKEQLEEIPNQDSLREAVAKIDYRQVRVNDLGDSACFTSPQIRVDVGGIAKGFALREMGILLNKFNIKNYLIVAGGDVWCQGTRHNGEAWNIGVRHPRNPNILLATLRLERGSMVTSGDYERYFIKNGTRYHHIFDPKTGMPCTLNQSLTIWAPGPLEADILSTGLFCRTADSIMSYINTRPSLEALAVDSAGVNHVSEGWKNVVVWMNGGQ